MSSDEYCKYCNKHFRFRDLYDQHVITCDFFHKRKKSLDREIDYVEKVPPIQDIYHLVQFLMLENDKTKKELNLLRASLNRRTKKDVFEVLNDPHTIRPEHTFQDWSKTICVADEHLEQVFKSGMTEGLKTVVAASIRTGEKAVDAVAPMRAFAQKQNTIYIYSKTLNEACATWRTMNSDDFGEFIREILHRFVVAFTKWQDKTGIHLSTKEADIERNIAYSIKIQNVRANEERQIGDLKKWIYAKLVEHKK
jgi:hypothetical protein